MDDVAVKLTLLGRFELRVGDVAALDRTFSRRRALALLKLLALQPGRSLHREQVYAALWPDLPSDAGANNLRQNLHHLRRALTEAGVSPDLLSIRGEQIALSRGVSVDIDEFRALARRARIDGASPVLYEGALALYVGDLLPDDVYEEWTIPARDELRSMRMTLMLELASAYCRLGQPGPAIERLSVLVAEDPLNEAAHRGLIESYALNGNQDRAIQQYDILCTLLRDELNAQPSELTEQLVRKVRFGRIALNGAASRVERPPPIHYAKTADGVDIAYWSIGSGPVIIDTWSTPHTHIAREWELPEWRAWYTRLAREHTVVRYDARGCGLSAAAAIPDFTIDNHVLDLEAVVDRLGLQKFAVLGTVHLGPAAIAYAVKHPEQVTHLILWCTYIRGSDFFLPERVPAMRRVVENDYELYARTNAAELVGWAENDDLLRRFAAFWYKSTRPDVALAAIDAIVTYDVSELLPSLRTPTLIVHYAEPRWLSVENANRLHSAIRHSRLALLDGNSPIPWLNADPEAAVQLIEDFLNGKPVGEGTVYTREAKTRMGGSS